MPGAYHEIPLGRTYLLQSNVASRLSNLSATLTGATLFFMAKRDPLQDADADAVLTATPTANVNSNVVSVAISAAATANAAIENLLYWEISCLTNGNAAYYTLDGGRMALVQPVRIG